MDSLVVAGIIIFLTGSSILGIFYSLLAHKIARAALQAGAAYKKLAEAHFEAWQGLAEGDTPEEVVTRFEAARKEAIGW